MFKIRSSVFETNSSSSHTITICDEGEFEIWKSGKMKHVLFCPYSPLYGDKISLSGSKLFFSVEEAILMLESIGHYPQKYSNDIPMHGFSNHRDRENMINILNSINEIKQKSVNPQDDIERLIDNNIVVIRQVFLHTDARFYFSYKDFVQAAEDRDKKIIEEKILTGNETLLLVGTYSKG